MRISLIKEYFECFSFSEWEMVDCWKCSEESQILVNTFHVLPGMWDTLPIEVKRDYFSSHNERMTARAQALPEK
jgi:hypothetical protein